MTTYILSFSNDPIVTLPVELARLAGLQEGVVQVIPGEHALTVATTPAEMDYAVRWQLVSLVLHEQAASYGQELDDRRDEAYWAIVDPLLEDAELWAGSL